MRNRGNFFFLLVLVLVLPLLGLGEAPEATKAPGGFDPSKLRVGDSVSGAYVDPDSLPQVAAEDIKALGFEYDEGALTYELVWSDEFEVDGLPNPEQWGYDQGGHGWGNNELQFYTRDQNAWVEGGNLIIEARRQQLGNREYTSARLVTRNKGDWLYGRFEIRAQLPSGLGTWPAIWMLPTDWHYGDWPASGEIDIMEHVGYDQDRIHATVHTEAYYHGIGTQKGASRMLKGASEGFHVYSLTWLPDKITAAIDGETYYTYRPTDYVKTPTYREWPFDMRHHLLLNIAFGGNWGGARGVDETVLPQRMLIDYVRVYQSPEITVLEARHE